MRLRLAMSLLALVALCTSASYATIGWTGNIWPCQYVTYADNQDINVYVQVWKGGCTDVPGPCADVQAILNYKRVSQPFWTTVVASYQGEQGSNDEWYATIPAAATETGDPMQYYYEVNDLSDGSSWADPICTQCECVEPYQVNITPATEQAVTVHFSVDMNCLGTDLYSAGVFMAGDFQGWSPCVTAMTDGNNDGIYEGTYFFPAGSNPAHEYKHNRAGTDGCQWEGVSNRLFTIDDSAPDMYLPTVKWDNWECCQTSGPLVIDAPGSYCLQLCGCDNPLSIWIQSPYDPPVLSGVTFAEGCEFGPTNCDYPCTPGSGTVGWGLRQDATGAWYMDLCVGDGGVPGCFCMTIDQILPVEFGTFDAVSGDNEITLNWNTLSETENAHFDIERDGELVGRVQSLGNTTSGHEYTFRDLTALNGTNYLYTLFTVSFSGERAEVGRVNATPGGAVASEYALYGNFPNPFNPTTSIRYSLGETGLVSLKVYDLNGRFVTELVNEHQTAGSHTAEFSGANLSSGIYFYTLTSGSFSASSKMVLLK